MQIEKRISDKDFNLMAVELYRARKYSMEVANEKSIRADLVGGGIWIMPFNKGIVSARYAIFDERNLLSFVVGFLI